MVEEIDRWVVEGRFASRSEAIKNIVTLYNERERTRRFYQMLSARSDGVRKRFASLVLLDDFSRLV
jgi:Arc/MetJ-type ribon-helix-helix transcriptional regulator